MKEITKETITELVSNILETMAFVFAESLDEQESPSTMRHSKISYAGPDENSDLYLSASPGFLAELASSMLGAEPDEIDVEVVGRQALDELANIVCGEVVLSLGGEDEVFSMGLPETIDRPRGTEETERLVRSIVESDEGERLEVLLTRSSA